MMSEALDDVAQLADVARPARARTSTVHRLGLETPSARRPYSAEISAMKCAGEQRDVLRAARAAAARGTGSRSGGRRGPRGRRPCGSPPQVLVGGGDDAHVHGHRRGAAHRLHPLLLQDAQDLGLRLEASCPRPRRGTACPPSASSNLPFLAVSAPVKAPRVWPKSSLSISSSGMAAQLTSTNGPGGAQAAGRGCCGRPAPCRCRSRRRSSRARSKGAACATSSRRASERRALAHHLEAVLDLLLEDAVLAPPAAAGAARS